MAGADEYDSTVSQLPVPSYSQELIQSDRNYKIAFMNDVLQSPALQPAIKANVESKLNELKSLGHVVEGIDFPLNEYVLPTYYILATAEASSNLSRFDGVRYGYRSPNTTDLTSLYKKTRAEGFGKEVQRRILLGTFVLSASYYDAYYTKAQKVRRLIRDQLKEVLKKYDFIVTPTTPTTAFKLGTHSKNPVEMYLADLFSVQANVAGIPAISVPCGKDAEGLPIGLQIMADDFQESKLFQFSKILLNLE
jgi:aspartyl-tRNA(Asn)/glutamyl-tRNA(Gln) amidotransferase subunit A